MNQFETLARRVLAFAGVALLAAGCTIVLPADPPDDPPPPPPPPPPAEVLAFWTLDAPSVFCEGITDEFSPVAECQDSFPANEQVFGTLFIDAFGTPAEFVDVFSNCGDLAVDFFDPNFAELRWVTPPEDTFCTLSAIIFLADGRVAERSLNVSVGGPTPPPPPPPPPPGGNNDAFWSLSHDNGFCDAAPGDIFANCSGPIPNGSLVQGFVEAPFQDNTRALGIRDNCGGEFLDVFTDHQFFIEFTWRAIDRGADCSLSLLSVSEDGRVSESRIIVPLTDDGQPPPPPPPGPFLTFWSLFSSTGECFVSSEDPTTACPEPILPGDTVFGFADFFVDGVEVIEANLIDQCGGQFNFVEPGPFSVQFEWVAPVEINDSCNLTLLAVTADGQQHETSLSLTVSDGQPPPPPPPGEITVDWSLSHANGSCTGTSPTADCDLPIQSNDAVLIVNRTNWGTFTPGQRMIDTDCPGTLEVQFSDDVIIEMLWFTPPVDEVTTCEFLNVTESRFGEIFSHTVSVTLVP